MKLTKWFLFVSLSLLFSETIQAQKNHFIYIQTDNKQPFYVRLDKKIYSSSTTGYLIIPKLINGDYVFAFGFPKNEWQEQKVTFTVKDNDAGYLFKNFGDKGWGFYNLQTLAITMAGKDQMDVAPKKKEIEPVVIKEIQKQEPQLIKEGLNTEVVKDDTKQIVQKKDTEIIKPELAKSPVKEAPQPKIVTQLKQTIERTVYNIGDAGAEMVYKIRGGEKDETISIFIPADKEIEKPIDVPKEMPKKEEKKFIDIIEPTTEEVKPVIATQEKPESSVTIKEESKSTLKIPNSNCKTIASEDEYVKLRKKIVNARSEDEMFFRSHEGFKKACYSTEQIRTLGFLFLSNESKYKFFDTAYPFASDSENFSTLENMFTDTYWKNRFKAMIHP